MLPMLARLVAAGGALTLNRKYLLAIGLIRHPTSTGTGYGGASVIRADAGAMEMPCTQSGAATIHTLTLPGMDGRRYRDGGLADDDQGKPEGTRG
jgi:hypothetical protein